jgi:MarR family 2-MHQ and catechol resistance regulon transcriptional repressor
MTRLTRPGTAKRPENFADNEDSDEKASLQLILTIGRSFKYVDDQVRPRMLKLGLTMTEFSVLATLYRGGPIALGELSDRILLTGASTTYTVKKLEQRGLLVRRAKEEDRRIILGSITDEGRTLLRRIFPLHAKHLSAAMTGITTDEKKSVATLLRKLQAAPKQEDS